LGLKPGLLYSLAVFVGCETSSLTQIEEYMLGVFGDRMLRGIIGPGRVSDTNMEKVTHLGAVWDT
jgi:hypothetical protein